MDEDGANTLYRYKPLEGVNLFRTLEIQPAAPHEPIICLLKRGELNDGQKYEALSYPWGDPTFTHIVKLEGLVAYVSKTLHDALHTLRDEAKPVVLWADQLCINQADAKEREQQVSIMGDIYRNAERVAVHAGDHPDGNGAAVVGVVSDMVRWINEQVAQYHDLHDIPSVLPQEIPLYESIDWKSFRDLATSTWTQRIWIRQEVGFARSVRLLYQQYEISWEHLMLIDRWLRGPGLALRNHLGIPDLGSRLWASFDPSNRMIYNPFDGDFLSILKMTSLYDASDPRDHIYGLLGHPTARRVDGSRIVEPHYTWSLRAVYMDFARGWMDYERDLSILHYAGQGSEPPTLGNVPEFPSWCPQWHLRTGLYTSVGIKTPTVDYRASSDSTADYQWLEGDRLAIKGFKFGTISDTFEVFPKGHISYKERSSDVKSFSSIVYTMMQQLTSLPLIHSQTIEALAMTISAGHSLLPSRDVCRTSEADSANGRKLHTAAFCSLLRQQVDFDLGFNLGDFPEIQAGITEHGNTYMGNYLRCTERYPINKRVCVVDGQYLSLGPANASEGDIVCILFGAIAPFFLRPVADDTYLLLGDCYVHDIMYGEGIDKLRSQRVEETYFVIR